MKDFHVLQREEVTEKNRLIFDKLASYIGKVPNLYAGFAWSANALTTYLTLQNSKSSLSARQKEVVSLVVSGVNKCTYCLQAHATTARLNDFTAQQIAEISAGTAVFDGQLDALARLARSIAVNHGQAEEGLVDEFYSVGYTTENLVDLVIVIGDGIMSNYLQALLRVPVDFPWGEGGDEVAWGEG